MMNYLGILGDPAKESLYDPDFYRIFDHDKSQSSFYLLGASENDVSRSQYQSMYQKMISANQSNQRFDVIPGLTDPEITSMRSRIGLFPSSISQLIRGPSFALASYPVNSTKMSLKIKSNIFKFVLSPFLPFKVLALAYFPLGGKAAQKTHANTDLSIQDVANAFLKLRKKNRFDWYYLEAGSGENTLSQDWISNVLISQASALLNYSKKVLNERVDALENGTRIIIPGSIYGGGITSVSQLQNVLSPSPQGGRMVPEIVVVGNISEQKVSTTYDLVDTINSINEVPAMSIDNLR